MSAWEISHSESLFAKVFNGQVEAFNIDRVFELSLPRERRKNVNAEDLLSNEAMEARARSAKACLGAGLKAPSALAAEGCKAGMYSSFNKRRPNNTAVNST